MTIYASLAEAKGTMQAGAASNTTEDPVVLRNLRIISRRIDRLMPTRSPSQAPYFAPTIETREFPLRPSDVNTWERTWKFSDPLLALTAITVGTDTLTINTDVKVWPPLDTPIHKLILASGTTQWYDWCDSNADPLRVKLTGTWGFHHDWANAFLDVTTLSAAIASTTVTTITLTDIDGVDAYGNTPWISAGHLLQIDSEWLEVTATNTTTNVATVRRGVNGSTAATHLINATVSVYQVEEDIRYAVARQAGVMYARRGAYQQVEVTGVGIASFPPDLLSELKGILTEYAYQ